MQKKVPYSRIFWLDVARVTGIISISLNHAVNRSYDNYRNQMEEFYRIPIISSMFKAFVTVFSHLGVPLFLMITGALLLNRRYERKSELSRFYSHNLLSIFVTTEIWYVLMYFRITAGTLLKAIISNNVSEIGGWLLGLIKTLLFIDQVTFDSMWYMPMILCVYVMIPIVALALRKWSILAFGVLISILFTCSMLIPGCNLALGIFGSPYQIDFAIKESNLLSVFFLYLLAGYWIKNEGMATIKEIWIIIGAIISFTASVFLQFFAYSRKDNFVIGYEFPLIMVTGLLLFELIRRQVKNGGILRNIITYISRISFGIYFVHIMIMTVINKMPVFYCMTPVIKLLYLELVSFVGSIIVIYILSKSEVLKNRLFIIK